MDLAPAVSPVIAAFQGLEPALVSCKVLLSVLVGGKLAVAALPGPCKVLPQGWAQCMMSPNAPGFRLFVRCNQPSGSNLASPRINTHDAPDQGIIKSAASLR